MAKPILVPATEKGKTAGKPVLAKEKAKVLAFVNWEIIDAEGNSVLRSNRGFSLLDNDYLTLEDKALIQLATENEGSALVNARLRIVLHHEKPETLDISKIQVIKKAA